VTATRPHVLIVGGVLTEPLAYRHLADRLREHGAASVTVAPVHVIDWLAAAVGGLGPLLVRAGLAIRRTAARTGGAPLLVVGHSGGGILARLAMAPEPFEGRHAGVAGDVGALVTLGTPHDLARATVGLRHPGVAAARWLARTTPGAWFAPATGYLTVASRATAGGPTAPARPLARFSSLPFRLLVGPIGPRGGDGIVDADLAHLEGARQLTFPDVLHGVVGAPWYGDADVVERWWPVALDAWRCALDARARVAAGPSGHGDALPGTVAATGARRTIPAPTTRGRSAAGAPAVLEGAIG
jgi:hypothetical protein